MRIIGGHDYYDSALAYGRDDTIVFKREKELTLPSETFKTPRVDFNVENDRGQNPIMFGSNNYFSGRNGEDFSFKPIRVIFCGKEYNGFRLEGRKKQIELKPSYIWNFDEFNKIINANGWYLNKEKIKFRWGELQNKSNYDIVKDHFEKSQNTNIEIFIEKRISIATWESQDKNFENYIWYDDKKTPWKINGFNLKGIQFYKVIDAFTAYQELSMWVGGVLPRSGNPMIEITDQNVKIHKAGFDTKTSFRKPKQKK